MAERCLWEPSGAPNDDLHISGLLLNMLAPSVACTSAGLNTSELVGVARQHKENVDALSRYVMQHPDDAARQIEQMLQHIATNKKLSGTVDRLRQLREDAMGLSRCQRVEGDVLTSIGELDACGDCHLFSQVLLSCSEDAALVHHLRSCSEVVAQELQHLVQQGLLSLARRPSAKSSTVSSSTRTSSQYSAELHPPARTTSTCSSASSYASVPPLALTTSTDGSPDDDTPSEPSSMQQGYGSSNKMRSNSGSSRSSNATYSSRQQQRDQQPKLLYSESMLSGSSDTASGTSSRFSAASERLVPRLAHSVWRHAKASLNRRKPVSLKDIKALEMRLLRRFPSGDLITGEWASRSRATCIAATSSLCPTLALGLSSGSTLLFMPDPVQGKLNHVSTLIGHSAAVSCMMTMHEGAVVLTGSLDGSMIVWRQQGAYEFRGTRVRFGQPVVQLAVAEQAGVVAVAHGSHVSLWAVSRNQWQGQEEVAEEVVRLGSVALPRGKVPCALALSDDGSLLFAGCGSKIHCWRRSSGQSLQFQGTIATSAGQLTCLVVSPCGQVLASGFDKRCTMLWDVSDVRGGKVRRIQQLPGHQSGVMQVTFSEDGHELRTLGSAFSKIRLYRSSGGSGPGATWQLAGEQSTGTHAVHVTAATPGPEGLVQRHCYVVLPGGRYVYKLPYVEGL